MAKRAGKEAEFTEGKTEMDWLKEFYQTAFDAARKNRVIMPKFEKFWEDNKPITFHCAGKSQKMGTLRAIPQRSIVKPARHTIR